jgi:hypothetical protein
MSSQPTTKIDFSETGEEQQQAALVPQIERGFLSLPI